MPPRLGNNQAKRGKPLAPRERQILGELMVGRTPREISGRIYISPKTIEHHMKNIREKLGAKTTYQAIAIWVQDHPPKYF